jgi:hypothetical protein
VPLPLRQVLASLPSDAVADFVTNSVRRTSIWRRGQLSLAISRHPSSPSLLLATSYSSTQVDLETPLSAPLLMAADLPDEQGEFLLPQKCAVLV